MKANEVEVGGVYSTKVGTHTVEVRIDRENSKGGWDATSVASGKPVRVKDASRLKATKAGAADDADSQVDPRVDEGTDAPAPTKKSKAAKQPAPKEKKAAKPKAEKQPGKLSCLDAAAEVLKQAGEPLQTKVMIERMGEKGLWSSTAPTPAATLYSAILREITTKADKSRFRKTDRGHFGLNA